MMVAAEQLGQQVGLKSACEQLNVPRSSIYRKRQGQLESKARPKPSRALSDEEKGQVREVLNSERFCDNSPRQVYATLLDDEEVYLCSWRTMYRILAEHDEVRERRRQRNHPQASKPHLVATGPGQLWSWDITKLKGPSKWSFYYLYVIIDVYSRYVVGWMVAERESAPLAQELIQQSCAKEGIEPEQLTLHADRGSPMRSKTVALLLADLGVIKSHARPYTPNDNAYSEAQFKTMKYRPDFPERFGCLAEARSWGRTFFEWYNHNHRHSALGLLPPAKVHLGQAETIRAQRQQVLQAAYAAHPERFVHGPPSPPSLPTEVWINQPQSQPETDTDDPAQPTLCFQRQAAPTPDCLEPGAQNGSRVPAGQAQRPLEAVEHLATIEQVLETANVELIVRV